MDPDPAGHGLAVQADEDLPDEGVHVLRVLAAGRLAGADRPDGLVGDDEPGEVGALDCAAELLFDHHRRLSPTARDQRFADLPFVVGDGAQARVGEFLKILEASSDLRGRIRAGVLVSQRRWNLKLNSGIDVKLPEIDPAGAAATLARLQREGRILEKDLIAIDMRQPGRVVARLSEDAAAARAEALSRKPRGKGGTT